MAHLADRRLMIGGKPTLVLSGEIHYFRLRREEWKDRIEKAREAGCNAVASYIPWIYHEEVEGQIDVLGRSRPEHDLGAFIDLCKQHGLWFIARPGPFVMAEMKNEGIPDWIYTRCPDAIPTTWGGKKATSKTLSYLNSDFLRYVERWYGAVMPVIAQRLENAGGNVIAVQLDNEIGMLQCWTEEADLSEDVLCEFTAWVQNHYSHEDLQKMYPFDVADPASRDKNLRDGTFATSRYFHADYTEFTRDRFSRYVATLRGMAENVGVRGIPFIVNIHGSGGGRATTFPIGISQTFRAYTQAPGYWGASDHYLGELTRQNAGDLYFMNAFMAAVNRPEHPLCSIEFEAGTGDYGENGAVHQSGAASDFKARLSVVQGNRLLNHYLLAGGHNPLLEHHKEDGNSRVGTTGGRHGFAAPIDPEGHVGSNYNELKETNESLNAVGDLLARMDQEVDEIALGFVPDYYSTDVKRPGPMMDLASQLEGSRSMLEGLVRSMMACGLSFPALNLQSHIPVETKAIALASASCLDGDIQKRLLEFVHRGGHLLLFGKLPNQDMAGRPTSLILDALNIDLTGARQGSGDYFPSLKGVNWASNEPEVRTGQYQPFQSSQGKPFLQVVQSDSFVGATFKHGAGSVVVITSEYPLHLRFWHGIMTQLGAIPKVSHTGTPGGVLLHRMASQQRERFISLINLDQEDQEVTVMEGGLDLFDRSIFLPGRKAKLLPQNIHISGLDILMSTAEISRRTSNGVYFRQTAMPEWVELKGRVRVMGEGRVTEGSEGVSLVALRPGRGSVQISR